LSSNELTGKLAMKKLKQEEVPHLLQIKNAIENKRPLNEILEIAESIRPELSEPEFTFSYAACLLANHHREKEAIELFGMNPDDTFCTVMKNFIEDVGEFKMVSKVFKDARPYHIYTQTPLYKAHEAALVKNISKFAKTNPPPSGETVTIIDIGQGDGELTAQYVSRLVDQYNLEKVRLVFIDPFEDQMHMAAEHCKEAIPANCEIIKISAKAQELSAQQVNQLQSLKPVWFITAALSVHHMPKEQKIPMLRTMKSISDHFILAEVDWDHDLPAKDSPELIWSVARNYGFIYRDVLELPISVEERKLCLYHFLVDEAVNILKQDRNNRIDYHTQIPEWQSIAQSAGYRCSAPTPTYMFGEEPFIFMMEFY
jgi:hypothetical protein